ncbi:hypothetical protein CGRA01v4_11657 [Colletotrichum graminicola]|nr:hypothetical protein CGRA01v4_11657 [Colletotrichum graminicola]
MQTHRTQGAFGTTRPLLPILSCSYFAAFRLESLPVVITSHSPPRMEIRETKVYSKYPYRTPNIRMNLMLQISTLTSFEFCPNPQRQSGPHA